MIFFSSPKKNPSCYDVVQQYTSSQIGIVKINLLLFVQASMSKNNNASNFGMI